MSEIFSVVIVICTSALICTLVSSFVNDSSIKKVLNLVLGAFIICSMILPVKNAVSAFDLNIDEYKSAEDITSTSDEVYSNQIVSKTKENLEKTLKNLLEQNDIKINSCEIILSLKDDNSIIISSISIYISKEYTQFADKICDITIQNFSITPSVMTE